MVMQYCPLSQQKYMYVNFGANEILVKIYTREAAASSTDSLI
jgi:hypothetical protein